MLLHETVNKQHTQYFSTQDINKSCNYNKLSYANLTDKPQAAKDNLKRTTNNMYHMPGEKKKAANLFSYITMKAKLAQLSFFHVFKYWVMTFLVCIYGLLAGKKDNINNINQRH